MKKTTELVLFQNTEAFKSHKFHRFSPNDISKMIYYVIGQGNSSFMYGETVKIQDDSTIDSSEYKKIDDITKKDGFIGFVKRS